MTNYDINSEKLPVASKTRLLGKLLLVRRSHLNGEGENYFAKFENSNQFIMSISDVKFLEFIRIFECSISDQDLSVLL